MIIIKSRFKKYYVAKFKDISINITLSSDIATNQEYLKISLFTRKFDPYMDMYFAYDAMPDYVKSLYYYVKDNNKISHSEDGLSYVLQGPSLNDRKMYKMAIFFIEDYNVMTRRQVEFIYDKNLSLKLAKDHILPIIEHVNEKNDICI